MREESKKIGETFRKQRLERNVSLKEAENATSIRISYLKAIEEGDLSKLISPVYAQGFIKQYASFLGLDGEEILKESGLIFSRAKEQEFVYGIGTLEIRDNPSAGVKWFPNVLWVILFFLIALFAWFFARYLEVL